MDPDTERAFAAARYRVFEAGRAWLMVPGRACPELARLLVRSGCREAALITAANPATRRLGETENACRCSALRARIDALGLACLDACNSAPDGGWRERSLLCLGLGKDAARALGRAFGQLAILHAGADAIPRLLRC